MDVWTGLDKDKNVRCLSSNVICLTPLHLATERKPCGSNSSGHTMDDRFRGHNGHGKAGNSFDQSSMDAENTSHYATE